MTDRVLRLLVVPGTTPGRWVATWRARLPIPLELVACEASDQAAVLAAGDADLGLVRIPFPGGPFGAELSVIPLYDEVSVAVLPTDHALAEEAGVVAADLSDDLMLVPGDDVLGWMGPPEDDVARPATTAAAVELVAAGVGVLVVPMSLARLHHRRDVTAVPVTDAPTSAIALAWVTDRADELTEEFVGIVRGRTVNSSRGIGGATAPEEKRTERRPDRSTRGTRSGSGHRGPRDTGRRRRGR